MWPVATKPREEVKELVDFLRDPQKFQKLGGRIPRGVLMVGPPGTGKTLLAKSIAGEARCRSSPFPALTLWKCSLAWVQPVFATCSNKPRRMRLHLLSSSSTKSTPWAATVVLAWAAVTTNVNKPEPDAGRDGRLRTNMGVIVIAATNRPDILDPLAAPRPFRPSGLRDLCLTCVVAEQIPERAHPQGARGSRRSCRHPGCGTPGFRRRLGLTGQRSCFVCRPPQWPWWKCKT